ncbi:hypothetical protein B296_00013627 [Ensete ventricosum]|uniref:Vps72/YL1 C-terminal domain-containing protein n=1 Tax=Ensete ventricosum TaxID=4639 RepID=A0A427B8A8_ENSVE|nr:hypothetical protein B296_00013627 [Ensete ventricosum]
MEAEVVSSEMVLPAALPFKRVQMSDKYPKGQSRGRHWKHLKQILQAENYASLPAHEPNYLNIESPPSLYPSKKYCDVTGFEFNSSHLFCLLLINTAKELFWIFGLQAPYTDPRTKLRYANPDVFKRIRSLPNEYVQRYLALRNAAIILR